MIARFVITWLVVSGMVGVFIYFLTRAEQKTVGMIVRRTVYSMGIALVMLGVLYILNGVSGL